MPVDVVTEIVIALPVDTVAAFMADPDNATAWYKNIKSVEWVAEKPVNAENLVGAKVAFVARFLGRRLAYTYDIVEHDPMTHMVMKTAQGPFPMATHYRWSATPTGETHVVLRNCGEPAGFARVTAPMMAMAMKRANENDLVSLKRVIEAPTRR